MCRLTVSTPVKAMAGTAQTQLQITSSYVLDLFVFAVKSAVTKLTIEVLPKTLIL
jgi:hypothetical protein